VRHPVNVAKSVVAELKKVAVDGQAALRREASGAGRGVPSL